MRLNEYSEEALTSPPPLETVNEYSDAALAEQEDTLKTAKVRTNLMGAVDQNPDEYATAKKLGMGMGIPASVVARNLKLVENKAKVNESDVLLTESPKLKSRMTDKNFANVAHDDLNSLAAIERIATPITTEQFNALVVETKKSNAALTWDDARALARVNATAGMRPDPRKAATTTNVVSGLYQSIPQDLAIRIAGVARQFADVTDDLELADLTQNAADIARQEQFLSTPKFESGTAQGIYSGAQSLLQLTPATIASIVTGNPIPVLAYAGLTTEAEAYTRYTGRGATGGEAFTGATLEGITEVATELMPMSFLVKRFGRVGAGELIGGILARDMPTEQIATFVQNALDTAIANPDKTWGQFAKEVPGAAYQTAIATIVQSAAFGGASKLASNWMSKLGESAKAEDGFNLLSALVQESTANKLRIRDAESFKQYVKDVSEGNVENVYVDGKLLNEAFAQNKVTPEEIQRKMPKVFNQLETAASTGGQVRIPMEDLLTNLVGTAIQEAILPHAKLSPEGITYLESQEFAANQETEMQQAAEKILAEKSVNDIFKESAKQVEDIIVSDLNATGRYSEGANRLMARSLASYFSSTADRMGITAKELYDKILPVEVGGDLTEGFNQKPITPEEAKSIATKFIAEHPEELINIDGKNMMVGEFIDKTNADIEFAAGDSKLFQVLVDCP